MRASSLYITVRQKAPVGWAIGRFHGIFEDITFVVERQEEILRDTIVVFCDRLGI